jgi:polyphenol oxidase
MEMGQLNVGADPLPLLISPVIPPVFRHGFTTRIGGVSAPPFDSLNLGRKWGDAADAVAENHRRLLAVSRANVMYCASQVHGTRILRIEAGADFATVAREQADGLASDAIGAALSVHVADCTPILMACPVTGACAALHAGWRGTVAGMAAWGVRTMSREFGCQPHDLRVALGPCIGACCFEVGPEVSAAFSAAMPDTRENGVVLSVPGRKDRIDLRRFQRLELEAAGVRPEYIDASADCTLCDPADRFFSYRRAGRATGQLVGFVVRVD